MKKLLIILFCFICFILSGCSNSSKYETKFTYKVIKDSNFISIIAEDTKNGINICIMNSTNDVIEIDWNSSNLGGSSIFMSGQKYADAGSILPSTVIPPYGYTTKFLTRANGVYFSEFWGEWKIKDIEYPTTLILKIICNGKIEFEVIELNIYKISTI